MKSIMAGFAAVLALSLLLLPTRAVSDDEEKKETRFLQETGFLRTRAVSDDAKDEEKEKEKNLLVNGSFEDGPEPDANNSGIAWFDEGATDIKGWTVTHGRISYISTFWQHADGKRSLDLHGNPGFGGIKQTFKTKKGQKYRVTFSMAASPGGTVNKKELEVSAAGTKEKFDFDGTDKNAQDMGWATQVWDFTATGDETTLEFQTLMKEDGNFGPTLDNVSVKAVEN